MARGVVELIDEGKAMIELNSLVGMADRHTLVDASGATVCTDRAHAGRAAGTQQMPESWTEVCDR